LDSKGKTVYKFDILTKKRIPQKRITLTLLKLTLINHGANAQYLFVLSLGNLNLWSGPGNSENPENI